LCAAITAGRGGARTLLIDPSGCVGGTASLGLPWCQFNDSKDRQIIRGIADEFLSRLRAMNACCTDPAIDAFVNVDNELYKIVAMELLQEAMVQVRLHTQVTRAISAARRIDALIVESKGSRQALRAKMFVDASGDGDVAALAGAPFVKGHVNDGRMQAVTMLFTVAHVDDQAFSDFGGNPSLMKKWREVAPGSAMKNPLKNAPKLAWLTQSGNRVGEWYVNATRVLNVDGTNPDDLSRAELEGRLQAYEFVEQFLRPHIPGFEKCYIGAFASRIGIRETRHITGDYTLNVDDVCGFRKFEDAIACCAYPIDIHDSRGAGGTYNADHFRKNAGAYYQIPYRCLTPATIDNLLVAGRCVSATHEAAGSLRVIAPAMAMGHAAGCAAAMAVAKNIAPRQLNVTELQDRLVEQNAFLGDVPAKIEVLAPR
jgi:hypothetical protein